MYKPQDNAQSRQVSVGEGEGGSVRPRNNVNPAHVTDLQPCLQ